MQKSNIVEKIAEEAGISKAAADRALKSLLDSVTQALKKGDRVSLVGFGTFSVSKRAARTGRNPKRVRLSRSRRARRPSSPQAKASKTR